MSTVIAIDAGQSTMKVRVSGADDVFEDALPGIRTDIAVLPQVADAARIALARSGQRAEILAAGVSGLTERDADPAGLAALLADTPVRRVLLAHDSTTSFLGALGEDRGAVVAAGTGVVTLGAGRATVARVDGWGHAMGDAGSGVWIGRQALGSVMRAYDGRGPATILTDAVRAVWPELPSAYIALQAEPDWVRRVASFALPVAQAAEAGDAVAMEITRRAARELALSVTTALRRVDELHDPAARVATVGGVFGSRVLREEFAAALLASGTAATIVAARGAGIDGVQTLARLDARHPFQAQVWQSTAGAQTPV